MAIQRALLLIADIGGYTRFMTAHRINLVHAHEMITQLLEAVIDGARSPLRLAKLKGDAAFFYAPLKEGQAGAEVVEQVTRIFGAFVSERRKLVAERICNCEGCVGVGSLKLKFVAHAGEVAVHKVKRLTELAGVDVIVVHRLLKNSVPVPEYALMTGPVLEALPEDLRTGAHHLMEDLEGIGQTATYYLDLDKLVPPAGAAQQANGVKRWAALIALTARTIPYWFGWKQPCEGVRNLSPLPADAQPAGPSATA